ncbi:MAG TPA: hypothetical protein VGK73_32195 [Polyangiaceae bacterium]
MSQQPYDNLAIPDSKPLGEADLTTVRDLTSPDTAHAVNVALGLLDRGDHAGAVLVLLSKLCLMDLRQQDTEAFLSVMTTHAVNYAEAVAAGLLEIEEEGEKQALARAVEFVLERRPKTTLADLVHRVKRLAVADAKALFSVDN